MQNQKWLIIFSSALAIIMGCSHAHAQTNLFFNKGDMTISISPTLSSQNPFDNKVPRTFGISYEAAYWQTKFTGTGLEIGSYDIRNVNLGFLDHIAVIENLRVVPWEGRPILGRFDGVMKLGAEIYLLDGSKDVELGVGIGYALSAKWQFEASYMQHWRTAAKKDGSTLNVCIKLKFKDSAALPALQ
jgi:hypothetical protein